MWKRKINERKEKTPSLELTVVFIGSGAICNSVIFCKRRRLCYPYENFFHIWAILDLLEGLRFCANNGHISDKNT